MAYDVSNLTTWVDERADEFWSRAVLATRTTSLMQVFTGLKSNTKIPDFDIATAGLIQDGSGCTDAAVGDIVFDQRQLTPKQMKLFTYFCNKDLEAYFTSKILPRGSFMEGLTTKEAQFVAFISARISEIVEILTWKGTLGVGAAPISLVDGLNEIIGDAVTAVDIPALQSLSGVQNQANIIATLEAMVDALPINNRSHVANGSTEYVMLMDMTSLRDYQKAYRATFTAAPYNQSFEKTLLDGTGIELIGAPGLGATRRVVLCKQNYLWMGVDVEGEENNITISQGTGTEMHKTFINADFKLAYNIQFPAEFVVNGY